MKGILLHKGDNVAVLPEKAVRGEKICIGEEETIAKEDVPALHKIAIRDIPAGEKVIKYGYPIGVSLGICAGEHVHTHNLRSDLRASDRYEYCPSGARSVAYSDREFGGFRRADGRVGIRNQVLILPTVGCINNVCEQAARLARERSGYAEIYAMPHPYGCSQLHDDLRATREILAGLASNPNNGGVVVVSLGCENNTLDAFLQSLASMDRARLRWMSAQDAGNEIEKCADLACALAKLCEKDMRTPCRLSELNIGLKCGGSDAFSGITANPVVGAVTDRAVGAGGSALMTEIPEMFGAEQLLLDRCVSRQKFEALAQVVQDFKQYFISHGESVGENPSPGNKEGGITTLEEKSLGCVLKGGHCAVSDVLRYGERLRARGLTVVEAPGNDATAQTALAAAGVQIILFTTGRGTPLGSIVPTLKIATNAALAQAKPQWIDFDASCAFRCGIDGAAEKLTDLVLRVAGGACVAAERNGSREIALWKRGVTL